VPERRREAHGGGRVVLPAPGVVVAPRRACCPNGTPPPGPPPARLSLFPVPTSAMRRWLCRVARSRALRDPPPRKFVTLTFPHRIGSTRVQEAEAGSGKRAKRGDAESVADGAGAGAGGPGGAPPPGPPGPAPSHAPITISDDALAAVLRHVPLGQLPAADVLLGQTLQGFGSGNPTFEHLVRACALAVEEQQEALKEQTELAEDLSKSLRAMKDLFDRQKEALDDPLDEAAVSRIALAVRKGLLAHHQKLRKEGGVDVGLVLALGDFERHSHADFLDDAERSNPGCEALVKFIHLIAHGEDEGEAADASGGGDDDDDEGDEDRPERVPSEAAALAALLMATGPKWSWMYGKLEAWVMQSVSKSELAVKIHSLSGTGAPRKAPQSAVYDKVLKVGRCRLPVSNLELKARLVSALETT
jgi:hypothetical protein